VYIQTIRNPQY
jgi:hypothetical protein